MKKILIGAAICVGCILLVVLYPVGGKPPDGLLHIYMLDVGQGDAVFITTPTGKQILIDSGPDASVISELRKVMPRNDKTIDMTIATHPDMDHIGGFARVLSRYSITTMIDNGVSKSTPESREWRDSELAEVKDSDKVSRIQHLYRGDTFTTGDGVRFRILHPDRRHPYPDTNNNSVTVRIDYDTTSALFTGDMDAAVEMDMINRLPLSDLDVDILKVAHHGSKYSSALAFLRRVSPELALISVACQNDYGHPHTQTLRRYAYFRIPVLTTCKQGTIEVVSDGKTFWVEK